MCAAQVTLFYSGGYCPSKTGTGTEIGNKRAYGPHPPIKQNPQAQRAQHHESIVQRVTI